jgi:hypothetical protein
MNPTTSRRFVGLAGILTAVLSAAIGGVQPPPPPIGAPGEIVVAYFTDHQMPVLILNYLGVVGLVPNVVLIAATAAWIRRREPADGWLWLLVLGSGVFFNAAAFGVLAMLQGTAYCAPFAGPELARVLADVTAMWFGLFFLTAFGYTASFAWAVLRTKVWPPWIAAWALVVGAVSFTASLGTLVTTGALAAGGPMTLVAFSLLMSWLFAYSILILAREPSGP